MKSRRIMSTARNGYIIISSILCILGLLLIIFPGFSMDVIGIVAGLLLLVFGGVRIIGYFSKDIYRLAFQYDLAFGILLAFLGIVMLCNPSFFMSFIGIIIGFMVFADGLFKIQMAFDSKTFGISRWWLVFGLAVITCVLGVALIFAPSAGGRMLMIMLGVVLLAEGILNFSTVVTMVKAEKKNKDYIDGDFKEL